MAAFWLAVIATIAVLGLPSSALAHAGHPHGGQDGRHAHSASSEIRHATEASRPSIAGAVVTDAAVPSEDVACAGPCCGWSGGPCCASGLPPETGPLPLADRSGGPALARDAPAPPGIVPEALPEPPRSFA